MSCLLGYAPEMVRTACTDRVTHGSTEPVGLVGAVLARRAAEAIALASEGKA